MTAQIASLFPELDSQFASRIYFGLGENGQIKIGITTRRFGHRGGEMHFYELCSVPGDRTTEDRYHARYASCRIGRTEWFFLTDALLLDLIHMCISQGRSKSAMILRGIIEARLGQATAA